MHKITRKIREKVAEDERAFPPFLDKNADANM